MLMSALKPLAELENAGEFVARHIGIDADDEAHMLSVIGAASRRALIEQIVPRVDRARRRRCACRRRSARPRRSPSCARIAAQNRVLKSFIGQGYHGTHTPGVILRNVLENPAWYTAYTPYQAEISQGRLEALVNFQTMVCDLTGMAIANASMLDEATAAAEAMTLALRAASRARATTLLRRRRRAPQTHRGGAHARRSRSASRSSLAARPRMGRLVAAATASPCCCSIPASSGALHDLRADAPRIHAHGAPVIVAADLLALTLLAPPGELGADIAVRHDPALRHADGQRRPARRLPRHAATSTSARLPGRLVGVSVDVARRRRPTGSRCRRASSTSGARRRPRTSARRRCCRRSSPACTRSTTGPQGLQADRASASPRYTAMLAAGPAAARLHACAATAPSTRSTVDTGAATDAMLRRRAATPA